jgi:SAM-dependent methyltransferase
VLGGETGRLALELAKRTELRIYAIEPDAQKVALARKALDEAGVYGARVCVDEGPLDRLPYSDYFANLVVSDRMLVSGLEGCSAQEMFRVLRPLGGVAFLGRSPSAGEGSLDAAALKQWLREGGVTGSVVEREGVWAKVVRRALPDAGGRMNTPTPATPPAAMTGGSSARWVSSGSAIPARSRWSAATSARPRPSR